MYECMGYMDAIVNNDNDNEKFDGSEIEKKSHKMFTSPKTLSHISIYLCTRHNITLTCYNMIAL